MHTFSLHVSELQGEAVTVSVGESEYTDPTLYAVFLVLTTPTQQVQQALTGAPDSKLVPLLCDGSYHMIAHVIELSSLQVVAMSLPVTLHVSFHARRRFRYQESLRFSRGSTASSYRRAHLRLDQALMESLLGNPVGFTHYLH